MDMSATAAVKYKPVGRGRGLVEDRDGLYLDQKARIRERRDALLHHNASRRRSWEFTQAAPEMGEQGAAEHYCAGEPPKPSTPATSPADGHEREYRGAECEAHASGGVRPTAEDERPPTHRGRQQQADQQRGDDGYHRPRYVGAPS